jgi:hypothetical protein
MSIDPELNFLTNPEEFRYTYEGSLAKAAYAIDKYLEYSGKMQEIREESIKILFNIRALEKKKKKQPNLIEIFKIKSQIIILRKQIKKNDKLLQKLLEES